MTEFLNDQGVESGTIVYYGHYSDDVEHVAMKSGGSGDSFLGSSKLGFDVQIAHDLKELEGGNYGHIIGGND